MDKQTFTDNILAVQDSLYRIAKSILIYDKDCEDAVQEAILKAWDKRGTLSNQDFFKTWITRILMNECFRIRKSGQKILLFQESSGPPETIADMQYTDDKSIDYDLQNAILHLPVKIRTVIVLHYIEGYNVAETAHLLRIPQGTVKSRLSKGRSLLKEALSK